ncbi:MAG: hypothetical protein WCL00_08660 [Bacteroidota bacterium]
MKTDKHGWLYYDKLPVDYIPGTLDDFHVEGKKKIGMEYLIKWSDREYYEIRVVKENLTGEWLLPFIEENRVFIKR